MTSTRLLAALIGAVVGASVGLVESLVVLGRLRLWPLDVLTVPAGVMLYGLIGGVTAWLWALPAHRGALPRFQVRTALFTLLSIAYLVLGFHINRLYLPEIGTLPSLLFTGVWTLIWGVGVWLLLRGRAEPVALSRASGARARGLRLAGLGLCVVFGLSFLPAIFRRGEPQRPSRQASGQRADGPNVLLIVMDTTRADHLSCYGYPRKTTPHLDRFAQEGIVFEQATAAAPWTVPSHASLFTGLLPFQHRADWPHQRLDGHLMTLAELLREHGYQTAGFVNNSWIGRTLNFHQGFDYFVESWEGNQLVSRLALVGIARKCKRMIRKAAGFLERRDGANAARTNRQIRRWLDEARDPQRPFFLFVNYLEPHFPYEPPEPYRSRFVQPAHRDAVQRLDVRDFVRLAPPVRFDPPIQAALTDLYDGEIAYLDMRVGELLEELTARRLLDHTVVIVTSDHGENLGDHMIFEHQFCIYETLVRVPLILRYPGRFPAGTRVTEPVSLVDVMPTLVKLLGLETPTAQAASPGRSWVGSALAVPPDRAILTEYLPPLPRLEDYRRHNQTLDERYFTRRLKSLRRGPFKFIWASDGRHELYDVSQDPGESRNLTQTSPDTARELEAELHRLLAAIPPVGIPEEVQPLDEATKQELRALGYLQ
jgi:arylsulfatase A-like enzyme